MRPVWLLALAALVLVPAASAQPLPTDPSIGVELTVTPASATVPVGGTGRFDVKVTVTLGNMVCPQATQVGVSLVAKDVGAAVAGIAGTLPANLAVAVPAGQYSSATGSGTGSSNATLVVTVASGAPGDHAHAFDITATGPSAMPSGCTAASPNSPAASTATKQATLRTGPAPATTTSGSPSTTSSSGTTTSGTQESFFVPLTAQVALLAALGLARRRYA